MSDDPEAREAEDRSAGRRMAVSTVGVAVILTLARIAGWAKEILLAKYFGASAATDAYKLVYNSFVVAVYTKFDKIERPTYLPVFVQRKESEGERAAWQLTGVLTTVHVLAVTAIALAAGVGAPWLVRVLWPNLWPPEVAVTLLRIGAVALVLFATSVIPELTCHSYKRFAAPSVAEGVFRIAVVAVLVVFVGRVWPQFNPVVPPAGSGWVAAIEDGEVQKGKWSPGSAAPTAFTRPSPATRALALNGQFKLPEDGTAGLIVAGTPNGHYAVLALHRQGNEGTLQLLEVSAGRPRVLRETPAGRLPWEKSQGLQAAVYRGKLRGQIEAKAGGQGAKPLDAALPEWARQARLAGVWAQGSSRIAFREGYIASHTWTYYVAAGVVLGALLRIAFMLPALRRELRYFRPSLHFRDPGFTKVLTLAPAVIVGILGSLARTVVDGICGQHIWEGAYTCLDWARRLPDAAVMVLPLAVGFVVFPYLSEWGHRGEKDKLADALVSTSRAVFFIFIPIAVGMMVLAHGVIRFVYGGGQFDATDAHLTYLALFTYAPGIAFYAMDNIINQWFFALSDTKTPNYVGVVMAGVHILIACLGVFVFDLGKYAIVAVAFALTFSKSAKIIILYGFLRGKIGKVDWRRVLIFAGKLTVCTLAMGAALHVASRPIETRFDPDAGRAQAAIYLALLGIIGYHVFLALAVALRVEEMDLVISTVRRKLARVL